MDAFYASVEQRDHPELRGKPVAVGGIGKRGVLTTCSYEARKYGVRSAMPGYKAKELCPDIIFMPTRFDVYKQVSQQIRNIFFRYTDLVEPLSLDEAFLDVTDYAGGNLLAMDIAIEIKNEILKATQLTASAGVSYCKFVAKIASDMRKPDGLTVIHPDRAVGFIESLPIERFFGVGKVTAARMKSIGIYSGTDLKKWSRLELIQYFGKAGNRFYNIVRGIDDSPVRPNRKRKSLAVERTLSENTSDKDKLRLELEKIIVSLDKRMTKSKTQGKTLTLKIKSSDFKIITRSRSFKSIITSESLPIFSRDLFEHNYNPDVSVRLIGLTISNLYEDTSEQSAQLVLDL